MPEVKKDKIQDETTAQVNTSSESNHQSEPASSEVSKSRRNFAKTGLLAAPILMSVASRPVFGFGTPCISNMMSGNLSHPSRGSCNLAQMGPTEWKKLIQGGGSWPNPITSTTAFDAIFGAGPTGTFLEVLENSTNSPEAAFVAAYANAWDSMDYILKPMQVQDLFNGLFVHVDPTPGATATKKTFLERTWSVGQPWDGTW